MRGAVLLILPPHLSSGVSSCVAAPLRDQPYLSNAPHAKIDLSIIPTFELLRLISINNNLAKQEYASSYIFHVALHLSFAVSVD